MKQLIIAVGDPWALRGYNVISGRCVSDCAEPTWVGTTDLPNSTAKQRSYVPV